VPHHRTSPLGEFELLVLLATLTLDAAAYPVSIAREIEMRTGRKASRTAVLITLERLEDKDLVSSRYGEATDERGGRPKRFFKTKPRGVQAVRESLERIRALTTGLEALLQGRSSVKR
jgi:PadR family transcriptional regulator PadR